MTYYKSRKKLMMWLKGSLNSFLIFTLFALVSCSKQTSPEIVPEEVKGAREIERLEACSRVNFKFLIQIPQNLYFTYTTVVL